MRLFLVALLLLPLAAEAKKPVPPPPPSWKCGAEAGDDYGTGFSALSAGKNDEAAAAFAAVIAKEPACGLALLGQGRALFGAGKAAEAVAPLTTASTHFADKPEVFFWLARAKYAANDDEGALAAARAAIVLKPNSVEAQRVVQDALIRKGDLAGARASLEAARATSNVVTWLCLEGLLAAAEGDGERAKGYLPECEGVPDRAVYDQLVARIAAMPPPPPPPAPPPEPVKTTKAPKK